MLGQKKKLSFKEKYEPMLTWKIIEKHFPWTIIFLVGGSLALADGCDKSGFRCWFGELLEKVIPNDKYLALLIISIFSMIGTEVIQNFCIYFVILIQIQTK